MFEHFENDKQEQFGLEEQDTRALIDIVSELVDVPEGEDTVSMNRQALYGLAILSFRAGRSFETVRAEEQYVTVHLTTEQATRWIESLLAAEEGK